MKTIKEFRDNSLSYRYMRTRTYTFVKNYDIFKENDTVDGFVQLFCTEQTSGKLYIDFYVIYNNEKLHMIPIEYLTYDKNFHKRT